MDQLKRRFYILGLSLLVLIVALAGLLGILDILPKPTSSTSSPDGEPTVSQQPGDNKPQDIPSQPSEDGNQPDSSLSDNPTEAPGYSISLPDSFNTQSSAGISPHFSLEVPMPPHLPVLEVAGAENTKYLKSITASFYDGVNWLQEELADYIEYNGELLIPPDLDPDQVVIDDITVSALVDIVNGNTPIPTSLYPVSVNSSVPLLYFPDDMTFLAEEEFPEEYIFETIHYIFSRQALANADLDLLQEYLQLPDNITPRTYELADNITGGIESVFLMAKALEDYLKTSYTYDFDYEYAPEGWEPNDWFLFEDKRGICGNFNSAFVILCRAAGIPSRLVGGFSINPQEEEQVVYQDQAHAWAEVKFKELGWYTFDATGSLPSLLPTVTEVTSAGPVTRKGYEFPVQGTVLTDAGIPAEGVLVEIFINDKKDTEGAVLIGKGIVADGRFDIQAVIPGAIEVGDYHVLAHCLDSIRYLESWSDPVIKVVTATNINMQAPSRLKIGEKLSLAGTLTEEFGGPLAGQQIELSLNGAPVATLVTDSAGRFAWEQAFNEAGTYTLKVSFPGTDYYLASGQEATFQVLSPAAIELNVEGSNSEDGAPVDEPVVASGRLTEEITGNPLPGRGLSVFIDGVLQDIKLVTDSEGRFDFKYTFDKIGDHRIEVKFAEDADYYEAKSAVDLKVSPPSSFSPWKIIIAVLALAAAGVGGWFLYRWLKNQPARPSATADAKAGSDTQATPTTPWQSTESGLLLNIEFPQITEPFPDVWGVGDELTIVLHLTDEIGAGLAVGPLDVLINDEVIARPSTGKHGKTELNHVFPAKGQFELVAKYEEVPDLNKASAGRPLRIVDYREEIVSLFDTLVAWFRERGIEISEEATPREIESLVLDSKKGIPEKALNDAVGCFEETDYSLHPISRHHYEIMYLAQREIKEHGAKPAAAAV